MAPRRNRNAKASPSSTKRPQFFRVLIPNPFMKQHIPQNFMKYLDGEQYNKATLLSPHGKFWHINLLQEGNDLYLDGGWSDFAKNHDLCTGYFVVFRYEGNMVFTVKVFDETCCLKKYELASCLSGSCSSTSNESSDVDCLTLSQNSEHEKLVTSISIDMVKDEVGCSNTSSSKKRKSVELSRGRITPPMAPSKNTQGSSSRSPTPPNKRTKRIPTTSSTSPIKKTKITPPSLATQRIKRTQNHSPSLATQPIKRTQKHSPSLAIQPIKKTQKHSPSLATQPIKRTQKHSPSSHSHPQFEKIVKPISSNYMSFPREFCIQNGLISMEEIILKNLKGKSYSVRLYDRRTEVRVGKGWKNFASENGIKDGITCIFELVNKSTVLVYQKNARGEIEACTNSSEEIANNLSGAIQYPQIEKVVMPFNLGLGYFTLPRSFCLENGLVSKRNVVLEDSDGKNWQVRFLIREDKAKLQKGWSKFSKAHNLEVGHKCIFTLVNENTFRVTIEKKPAEIEA